MGSRIVDVRMYDTIFQCIPYGKYVFLAFLFLIIYIDIDISLFISCIIKRCQSDMCSP